MSNSEAPRPTPVSSPKRRKFWTGVSVVRGADGWGVELDQRPVRTPTGRVIELPTEALAQAVAEEWRAQGDILEPSTMALTRLVNSAVDGVAEAVEATRADLLKYAGSDLLCYRAGDPSSLVAAQNAAWNPVLEWARDNFGARFHLAEGVIFVAQPAETLRAMGAAIDALTPPFALAACHVMTTLTGSAILAIAVQRRRLSAEEAWRAAHIDEDEQNRIWGEDAEAAERRARRWTEMQAAARLLDLL